MSDDPTPSRDYRAFEAGVRAAFNTMGPPPCFDVRRDVIDRLYHERQADFDASRLYYEAHLTVEPDEELGFAEFRHSFQNSQWRVSQFAEDDVDQIVGKWFITSRATSQAEMIKMVRNMRAELEADGLTVLRSKIEDTLLDTKHGDAF